MHQEQQLAKPKNTDMTRDCSYHLQVTHYPQQQQRTGTHSHPKKKRKIKQEAKDREQRARNSFPPPLKEQLTFFKQNEKQKQAVQAAT